MYALNDIFVMYLSQYLRKLCREETVNNLIGHPVLAIIQYVHVQVSYERIQITNVLLNW